MINLNVLTDSVAVTNTLKKKKLTKTDILLSKKETKQFWGEMFEEAQPHVKILKLWFKELMDSEDKSDINYCGIEFFGEFLGTKKQFIEGNIYAVFAPLFGDLPSALYTAYWRMQDLEKRQALWHIIDIICTYDHKMSDYYHKALKVGKQYGIYEEYLFDD